MRRLILVAVLVVVISLIWVASDPVVAWATAQQKALQGDLAAALRAVRSGDLAAIATMVGLCGLYGVVHAIGPGHGKMLIGGASIASQHTARRMAGLGLAASMAQGGMAIALVYGGLGLFTFTSRAIIGFSETWLTAASYTAIGVIGVWLIWRGAKLALRLSRQPQNAHAASHHAGHHHGCAAGCKHAPTVEETNSVANWRDAIALIASIGVRPCSGAMIVLALSWRFETYAVGVASVFAMALGTGLVVAGVALAAVKLRQTGRIESAGGSIGLWSFAAAQLCVGAAILIISTSLAAAALNQTKRAPILAFAPAMQFPPPQG